MTVYAVRNKETGKYRMVETNHRSNALAHVAGDTFDVTIPSGREAVELGAQGIEIEEYVKRGDKSADQSSIAVTEEQSDG